MTIKEVCKKYGLSQDTLRYYERIGVIPKVGRTPGGIRDYGEEDLGWIELAKCMRSAGLSIESLSKYVSLTEQGDETIPERLKLLKEEYGSLLEQRKALDGALSRLEYKISVYEEAERTGILDWGKKTGGEC